MTRRSARLGRRAFISGSGAAVIGLPLFEAFERDQAIEFVFDKPIMGADSADLAFGLLIDVARRISEADRFVQVFMKARALINQLGEASDKGEAVETIDEKIFDVGRKPR